MSFTFLYLGELSSAKPAQISSPEQVHRSIWPSISSFCLQLRNVRTKYVLNRRRYIRGAYAQSPTKRTGVSAWWSLLMFVSFQIVACIFENCHSSTGIWVLWWRLCSSVYVWISVDGQIPQHYKHLSCMHHCMLWSCSFENCHTLTEIWILCRRFIYFVHVRSIVCRQIDQRDENCFWKFRCVLVSYLLGTHHELSKVWNLRRCFLSCVHV